MEEQKNGKQPQDPKKDPNTSGLPEEWMKWLHPDAKHKKILLLIAGGFTLVTLIIIIAVAAAAGCDRTPEEPPADVSVPSEAESAEPESSAFSKPDEPGGMPESAEETAPPAPDDGIVFPDAPSEGLEYAEQKDGTLMLTGRGTCEDTIVVIPAEVDGKKVSSFASCVFTGVGYNSKPDEKIIALKLSEGIEKIDDQAFSDLRAMRVLSLPSTLKEIGPYAFLHATSLRSLELPEGLTTIGEHAFSDAAIEEVVIPDSVTMVHRYAFQLCPNLKRAVLGSGVQEFREGVFFKCANLTEVVLPEGPERMRDYFFSGCTSLRRVTLPSTLTSLGTGIFYACDSMAELEIGKGGKYVSVDNCIIDPASKTLVIGIATSVIPSDGSVTVIGQSAFYTVKGLTEIVLPDCITAVQENAFAECTKLKRIDFGKAAVIGGGACSHCSSLQEAILPEGITKVSASCFAGCWRLLKIVLPDSVTSVEGNAFRECSSMTEVVFGPNVRKIGDTAFWTCPEIGPFTLPATLESIGDSAFMWDINIKTITYGGTVEQWNAIKKQGNWCLRTRDVAVVCTDGTIEMSNPVTPY